MNSQKNILDLPFKVIPNFFGLIAVASLLLQDVAASVHARFRVNGTASHQSIQIESSINNGSTWQVYVYWASIAAGGWQNATAVNWAAGTWIRVKYGTANSAATVSMKLETNGDLYWVVPAHSGTISSPYFEMRPVVQLVYGDAGMGEYGNPPLSDYWGWFTVTRSGSTASPLTVYYTDIEDGWGPAIPNVDYFDCEDLYFRGSVTIPSGQTSAFIWIIAYDDEEVEGVEIIRLRLSTDANYAVGPSFEDWMYLTDND